MFRFCFYGKQKLNAVVCVFWGGGQCPSSSLLQHVTYLCIIKWHLLPHGPVERHIYAFQYIPVRHLIKHASNIDSVCQWFKSNTVIKSKLWVILSAIHVQHLQSWKHLRTTYIAASRHWILLESSLLNNWCHTRWGFLFVPWKDRNSVTRGRWCIIQELFSNTDNKKGGWGKKGIEINIKSL